MNTTTKAPKKRAAMKVTPARKIPEDQPKRGGTAATSPRAPKPMPPRVAQFVVEYLKDFNGTQAAIRAGYARANARQQGSQILTRLDVRQALAGTRAERDESNAAAVREMELTVDRTRLEIARIAYFDPRRLFAANGRPLALHELDDDAAAVVAGLEVLEAFEGTGNERVMVGTIKKWKLADKNAALDKASKILGIYERDNEQKVKGAVEALREFFAELHGAANAGLPIVAHANLTRQSTGGDFNGS